MPTIFALLNFMTFIKKSIYLKFNVDFNVIWTPGGHENLNYILKYNLKHIWK